jgi:hypothetical protein
MAKAISLILVALAFGSLCLLVALIARAYLAYRKFRGTRVITCPETEKAAAVRVDAKHLAIGVPIGERKLRLSECSRWPERRHCGQECLQQIEAAPEGCLVRAIATHWYQGKSCVLCRKGFGEIHWSEHKPALMDLNRNTVQWDEVPTQKLPEVLATHLPVCRSCHIAEWFRRRYPQLVVERPSDLAQVRHKSS